MEQLSYMIVRKKVDRIYSLEYFELSTVYNALDVLLFNGGCSKWICNASAVVKEFLSLCCDKTEKLLKFTEVGE